MNRLALAFGLIVVTLAAPLVSMAQMARTDTEDAFRFELAPTQGHRGLGVEGYVHNGLPWRISNIRLRVDSLDAGGTVLASASGWVIGDVSAGGRGYFYVPVSTPASTYRASVQAFDKVMLEAPQAP